MEAIEVVAGEGGRENATDVEIKEEVLSENAQRETDCQVQESYVDSTRISLEDEFGKWETLKNFLGISGIKSDSRLAGFLMNFWSDHKDCKQLRKKERKEKKQKYKQSHEPYGPKIKIPIRMTSRGRPIYQPNILQVKLTTDSRSRRSKRREALQKQKDAIKKAKIKKREALEKKKDKAKTKRKQNKVILKKLKDSKIIWRSDDEEDDNMLDDIPDDDADVDYTPAGSRKRKGSVIPAGEMEHSDGEQSDKEVPIKRKPKARRESKPTGRPRGRPRKHPIKPGEKLPPKKRKYLDRIRLKGETWYRCRIKKMMKYNKRFQCKICLREVTFITEVIDHIQNEHPDQILGFRNCLGPHLERCGLTVVWSLPEGEVLPLKSTEDEARKDGSVPEDMIGGGVEDEATASKHGNSEREGESVPEKTGSDGFAMGGGILKGGYMSLLVGDEANATSHEANAEETEDGERLKSEKVDGKEVDVGGTGNLRAVAVLEDGQTDVFFKDCKSDSQVANLEDDVDVLYELQGWVVIMIECPDCQEYVSIYSLPTHQYTHKPKLEHKCDICNKVYRRRNQLRNHEKRHLEKPQKPKEEEEAKTFMCELCGDVFRKAKYLKNHQLRHQGNLPYVCKICDRRFLFQRQLKRHDIIHREVKPILCQECGRGFVQQSQLNAHMRQHTGEKPYKCDLCERAFTHNVSLKTHKKRDHGIEVGKCANPHLGRPKMSGESVPKPKISRGTSSKKTAQVRNQTVISTPAVSQYSEYRMATPSMNHLPLGLVINPERQGMDLGMDSSDSPPAIDNPRPAPMQGRAAERAHQERHVPADRHGSLIHNMDGHSRPHQSEEHANMEHLGNSHIERSVSILDRHAGNGGDGNNGGNSGASHNSHHHFDRAMTMPLIERSLGSHLMERQGISPPVESRPGNAHSHHHMDHHPHHQTGMPLLATRPDQHLMRQKKGKDLDMPPHQNNPTHPPYPWGAWGNVAEGMGMRFPVFPQ